MAVRLQPKCFDGLPTTTAVVVVAAATTSRSGHPATRAVYLAMNCFTGQLSDRYLGKSARRQAALLHEK